MAPRASEAWRLDGWTSQRPHQEVTPKHSVEVHVGVFQKDRGMDGAPESSVFLPAPSMTGGKPVMSSFSFQGSDQKFSLWERQLRERAVGKGNFLSHGDTTS